VPKVRESARISGLWDSCGGNTFTGRVNLMLDFAGYQNVLFMMIKSGAVPPDSPG
jgi:hypothetical protein